MQPKAATSLIGRSRTWYGVVSQVETAVAMKIEILGTGCANCDAFEANVRSLVRSLGRVARSS